MSYLLVADAEHVLIIKKAHIPFLLFICSMKPSGKSLLCTVTMAMFKVHIFCRDVTDFKDRWDGVNWPFVWATGCVQLHYLSN